MSLMQLLTNGKTLVDLKHSTSRYQMPGKNFLPKFGPTKNPFSNPPRSQPAAVVVPPAPKPSLPAAKIPPAKLKETQRLPALPAKMKETKRLPFVAARKSAQSPVTEPAWWEKFLDWAGGVMAKANPAAWWASRKSPVKSAIPRFDKPVVQGELSLENIKVVRNDLSDADMEVVPAKTFTGDTNFKPALQPQASGGLAMSQSPAA
jgi:hypothetical protein